MSNRIRTNPRRVGAALALALLVALIAWLVLRGGDDEQAKSPVPARAPAVAMDLAQLRSFAASVGRSVYWAGENPEGVPASGVTYEVTQTSDGSIYIRYLPSGVAVGSDRPEFLTVGTYLDAKARTTMRQAERRPGARASSAPDGGTAVSNSSRPGSVYFASPNGRLLIEVYDPDSKRAQRIAASARRIR